MLVYPPKRPLYTSLVFTLASTPATMLLSGKLSFTTELAATIEFSPILTPGRSTLPPPIIDPALIIVNPVVEGPIG